jgi:hypothetical protein
VAAEVAQGELRDGVVVVEAARTGRALVQQW